jgi:hypothetical protein
MKKIIKKSPLNKLVLESLGEPFYLNIVRFKNDEKWFPCWHKEYSGATRRADAIRLRKDFLKFLQTYGNPDWSEKDLKTVKVEYYKFI